MFGFTISPPVFVGSVCDGSRGYDVIGMSKDQNVADVPVQFERYLALVSSRETTLVLEAPEHGQS